MSTTFSHSRQEMLAAMAAGKHKGTRANPEAEHQAAYFQILGLNEKAFPQLALIFAIPNGGLRSKKTAGQLKMQGVKAGVADVFIPIPHRRLGVTYHGCWIELKIKPNRATPAQVEFIQAMLSRDYDAHVAWSCDEMLDITEAYLGIKLNR